MKQDKTAAKIKEARARYDSYGSEWEKEYFDEKSGGFNVYHKKHQFTPTGGGGDAEKNVGKILAKLGKQVEFLEENSYKKGKPDINFDSSTWDIKYINDANIETIRGAIKDARKAQNAIFYWDKYDRLEDLKIAVIRSIGYFQKKNTLSAMPDIYYIGENRLINIFRK